MKGLVNSGFGRSLINGKAGKAAALPKFSDTLTLSQLNVALLVHKLYGMEKK